MECSDWIFIVLLRMCGLKIIDVFWSCFMILCIIEFFVFIEICYFVVFF